jgi:hypothetical protein
MSEKRSEICFACTLFLAVAFLLVAAPARSQTQAVAVTSTSLTAAIARSAGASEVRMLTPGDITHPPEYEIKPSDLTKLEGANIVVYAGYERMVARLVETSRSKQLLTVQIDTATSPENLIAQVRKVAVALKTEKDAEAWEKRFKERLAHLRSGLGPVAGKRAVVHFHAQPFARWAGLSVVQVVRPGEITSKAIADAIAQKPDVVIDILHLPMARTIAENARCRYVQVINFPGVDKTATLEDLFQYNAAQLLKAFQ